MSNKQTPAAVILAAGMGKRMASNHPKALCKVLGKPMINWVIDSCKESGVSPICVVASHEGALPLPNDIFVCYQKDKLGTGHGVMMSVEFLNSLSCNLQVNVYDL